VRLCLFLLLLAPMLPGAERKPPEFRRPPPVNRSNVCSIPLLEPPASHGHIKNFDPMAIPSPRSLDHNQIPPPAPPCDAQREFFRPKMLPKPPAPRPSK
jgi:hypothetical protein